MSKHAVSTPYCSKSQCKVADAYDDTSENIPSYLSSRFVKS